MDSSSLNILVLAQDRLTHDGRSLVLRNPSTAARRLLTVIQAEGLLDVEADEVVNGAHRTCAAPPGHEGQAERTT